MTDFSSINFHRVLINDRVRSLAYQNAIKEVVKPGDIVLDMGTGSGLLSLFACQAGASKVYAVEQTSIIGLAQKLAQKNGFSDRIDFINKDIRQIELQSDVDVIISELISQTIIGQRMEELTAFCRDSFLKPGGKIIPRDVDFFWAPVDVSEIYSRICLPTPDIYGLQFDYMQTQIMNLPHAIRLQEESLLSAGQSLYHLDSMTVTAKDHPQAKTSFLIKKSGKLCGLTVWFTTNLSSGYSLSNYTNSQSWETIFFPLAQPVIVEPGMVIDCSMLGMHPATGRLVFEWEVSIWDNENRITSVENHYQKQSTLASISPIF